MWNVFKKVWVKGKGVKAVLSDACNIGHVDEGDVTNGERTLFPQRFPWRSSLRMHGMFRIKKSGIIFPGSSCQAQG